MWGVHFVFYVYVSWAYYLSGMRNEETSDNIKIWIPLDILLTFNIILYQVYYNWEQKQEDAKKKIEAEEALDMDEMSPANLNSSLLGSNPRMDESMNTS